MLTNFIVVSMLKPDLLEDLKQAAIQGLILTRLISILWINARALLLHRLYLVLIHYI